MQQAEIFVPKHIAMELKKKGFNEPCVAYYSEEVRSYPISKHGYSVNSEFTMNGFCTAPTYDQVIGWFASKGIEINTIASRYKQLYMSDIWKGMDKLFEPKWHESRQQSLLTAFEEALKLI
jgi:hypothetical protein